MSTPGRLLASPATPAYKRRGDFPDGWRGDRAYAAYVAATVTPGMTVGVTEDWPNLGLRAGDRGVVRDVRQKKDGWNRSTVPVTWRRTGREDRVPAGWVDILG